MDTPSSFLPYFFLLKAILRVFRLSLLLSEAISWTLERMCHTWHPFMLQIGALSHQSDILLLQVCEVRDTERVNLGGLFYHDQKDFLSRENCVLIGSFYEIPCDIRTPWKEKNILSLNTAWLKPRTEFISYQHVWGLTI